jgi:hypothetical protein
MIGAEDLGEEGPEDDQGREDALAESKALLPDGLLDQGGIQQVGEGDLLGRLAEEMDRVAEPLAGTLAQGWPPCGASLGVVSLPSFSQARPSLSIPICPLEFGPYSAPFSSEPIARLSPIATDRTRPDRRPLPRLRWWDQAASK